MRGFVNCAAMAAAFMVAAGANVAQAAPSGEITVWAWNTAAAGLKDTVAGFNKQFPDVKVNVVDIGGGAPVYQKILAGCAAGGTGLPDVVGVQNEQGETIWSRFPDCFADLVKLGYGKTDQAKFPDFKRAELETGGKAFAMPWDSGPVVMFYRRDLYQKAGIDAATIKTWDDYTAAGKKMLAANPGVVMAQANLAGEVEWLRMMSQENHCGFFDHTDGSITINQPGCVAALEKLKAMKDAGIISSADWGGKLEGIKAGKSAGGMYGAWYVGSIQGNAPDQSGKWGTYRMPSVAAAGGAHAANFGGSSLAIPDASAHKEAAFAFVKFALETNDGQVTMLKTQGLVPSLLDALKDPYISQPLPYWGGQKVWADVLSTLPDVPADRSTAFLGDASAIINVAQTKFFNGEFPTAKAALDDAAKQIATATGLPIK
ncbi:MAG: extracellular solute-binding protein [Pseudomonadota bacterium]|nr:extracellular solute-binding protein [Pseudomonadota bacterium]